MVSEPSICLQSVSIWEVCSSRSRRKRRLIRNRPVTSEMMRVGSASVELISAFMLRHVVFTVGLSLLLLSFTGPLDQRDVNQQLAATHWHLIQVTGNEEPLCATAATPRALFLSPCDVAFAICRYSSPKMPYIAQKRLQFKRLPIELVDLLVYGWFSGVLGCPCSC